MAGKGSSLRLGIFSHGKELYKIAIDHIASTLDAEKAWQTYLSVLNPPSACRPRYVRLNPQPNEDPPRPDDVDKIRYIQGVVREQLHSDEGIRQVVLQLVAISFYFEKSASVEVVPNGAFQCNGGSMSIRLCGGSADFDNRTDLLPTVAG